MAYRLIGIETPYSKAFGRRRVFSGHDERWTRIHDVYLNVDGIEVNLNEQPCNVKRPEYIEEYPVVLKIGDISVTCVSFRKYCVYRKEA